MNFLETILRDKRAEVEERSRSAPLAELRPRALAAPPARSLEAALQEAPRGRFRVIAEIKRASPSKGTISKDLDAPAVATCYERAGAAAISVLTDEKHFRGRLEDLVAVRRAVGIPVLRKDFIIDPYQVWESRAAGADAILLIAKAVPDDSEIAGLAGEARQLGMDVLWEVHDGEDLDRVIPFGPRVIGINNRDLRTFEVSLETTRRLLPRVPPGTATVSESGFSLREDLERMEGWGVRGFLIGESLLRAKDPGAQLDLLIAGKREAGA